MKDRLRKLHLLRKACYLLILAFILLFLYHCPFDYLLGISCPGCGMTRALFCVLMLRFDRALYYHPGIFLILPGFLLWFLDHIRLITLKQRTKKVLLSAGIAALILIYFYRLLSGSDIVHADISSGLLYRLFHYLPK